MLQHLHPHPLSTHRGICSGRHEVDEMVVCSENTSFVLEILIFSISEALGASRACARGRVSWGIVGGVGVVWG